MKEAVAHGTKHLLAVVELLVPETVGTFFDCLSDREATPCERLHHAVDCFQVFIC